MENKYLITTLVILVLGLLLSGCGVKEETTPTDTTNEETDTTTGEKEENKTPTEENIGKSCEVMTDCGTATKEGQPFCLGGASYQRMKIPRCTLDKESNKICSYRMIDERIGAC